MDSLSLAPNKRPARRPFQHSRTWGVGSPPCTFASRPGPNRGTARVLPPSLRRLPVAPRCQARDNTSFERGQLASNQRPQQ